MVEEITLKKPSTKEELHMDMLTAPGYILISADWGSIEATHNTYKYLNQIGVSKINSLLGTREVSILGWVVAHDPGDMLAKKDWLNRFVNPQETLELFYDKYRIEFSPNSTVKYSINIKENNEVISKFQILGTAHDPMFTDDSENQFSFATTRAHFHFPLRLFAGANPPGAVFGVRTDSLIAEVHNRGSVPTGMLITFRAKGTIKNPKLINVNTQEKLVINKVFSNEEEVLIDTNTGKKSVRGRIGNSDWSNYFAFRDLDSDWLQLSPGENLFRYDADSGLDNLEVFVHFQNRFLEVQGCF